MAPRTRSVTSSPVKKAPSTKVAAPSNQAEEPRKILLLPTDLSANARLVLLPHPRDGAKRRFLFCPSKGLYEFIRVAAPPTDFQSILIADETFPNDPTTLKSEESSAGGYINKDAHLFVATPFDLLFLLLPLLPSSLRSSGKVLFQPLDDLLEAQVAEDRHFRHLIQDGRSLVEQRLESFCDTVDAGDEKMFRVSEEKTLALMVQKIKQAIQNGLPASLEERFVSRSLETPVLSVKREESTISTTSQPMTMPEDDEIASESIDSQSTTVSSAPSVVFSEVSVASSVTVVESDDVPESIKQLQRMKVVMDFILASYTSPELSQTMKNRIMANSLLVDFSPLNQHLEHLAKLRAEAAASRSIGDFSRKRGNADDEEAAEARADKKRRLEEDEKRKKAGESRGVRDLKKVNVTGMKKMSDFFKKPATAKAKS